MSQSRLPIVDAFLNKDVAGLKQIEQSFDSQNPLLPSAKALSLFLEMETGADGYKLYEKTKEQMARALQDLPSDPELLALIYGSATFFTKQDRRFLDLDFILPAFQEFKKNKNIGWDVHVYILCAEWRYHFKKDYPKQLELLDTALKLVPAAGSKQWLLLKTNRIESAILNHDFKRASSDLDDLALYRHVYPWQGLGPYELLYSWLLTRLGKYDEAFAIINSYPEEKMGDSIGFFIRSKLQTLTFAKKFEQSAPLLNRAQAIALETTPATLSFRKLLTTYDYHAVSAISALAQQNLPEARKQAQAMIDVTVGCNVSIPGHQYLLQCELISKNTRAARLILQVLDPDETRLHGEWIRLHILEKNMNRALEVLRLCFDQFSTEALHAWFRYAYEIPSAQLAWMLAIIVQKNKNLDSIRNRKLAAEASPQVDSNVLIGESRAMRQVREKIATFAAHDTPILLNGETGSGKEVVAHLLHQKSPRASEPFLSINCGALSETLIESELFGHSKGAFTGADSSREGLFVAAGKGTIFLDEVSSMSAHLQASLLRVLEEQEVRPVGSNKTIKVHARVIAATNEPLDQLVAKKQFRMDLYFRLARFHIPISPLRDRKDDIPLLVRHFIKQSYRQMDVVVGPDLIEALQQYDWPGNVRELKNEIERIALLARNKPVLDASFFSRQRDHPSFSQSPAASTSRDNLSPQGDLEDRGQNGRDRQQKIRKLFEEHERLTRAEIIKLIDCSPNTATRYLKNLEEENYIRRVQTSNNLHTSYFVKVKQE